MNRRYKMHMDTMGFAHKPDKDGESSIRKLIPRVSHNEVEVNTEELAEYISQGYSFIPGLCASEGRTRYQGVLQRDWLEQSFFFLDFDNSNVMRGKKLVKEIEYIPLQEAVDKLRSLGIEPAVAYRTYTSGKVVDGKEIEKFRIGFKTHDVVTDRVTRDKLQATLMGVMDAHIDPSCSNRNRYYNGTTEDKLVLVSEKAEISAEEIISQYWDESFAKYLPKDSELLAKNVREKKNVKVVNFSECKRKRSQRIYLEVDDFPRVYPADLVHNGLIVKDMNHHYDEFMSLVEAKLSEGGFDSNGTGRRTFIFTVFNAVSFKFDTRTAYQKCIEVNERFSLPLCTSEFESCTWNALEHIEETCSFLHETQFIYRYDTQLDGIGAENCDNLAYFKNKKAKEHADLYRDEKRAMHQRIQELYLAGHKKAFITKTIGSEFPSVAISVDGVKYFIKAHKEEWVAQADFQGGSFGTITNLYNNISIPEGSNDGVRSTDLLHGFSEEQKVVYDLAMIGANLAIQANGGTGKTYLLNQIVTDKQEQGESVGVCAATGLAAQAIGGNTLHHFFGITPDETYVLNTYLINKLLGYDCIIVDEIGMVDSDTFNQVCAVLKYLEKEYNHKIQLIVAGDVLQLQGVKGTYYFESEMYQQMDFACVTLVKNIRQSSASYAYILKNIEYGKDIQQATRFINLFASKEEDLSAPYLFAYKNRAFEKNQELLSLLPGEPVQIDDRLSAKIGAKVIVTANAKADRDGNIHYYNGMRGILKAVRRNSIVVETEGGALVKIKKHIVQVDAWHAEWRYPIELGYAITIHKAQGMTFDSINVDPECFAAGQLYTALSRVRSIEGLHLLSPVKPEYVKVSRKALDFVQGRATA